MAADLFPPSLLPILQEFIMAEVRARPGEGVESLLKRFKKVVENAGILADYRRKESYEKPSVEKKRKKAAAIKRAKKAEKTRRPKVSKANWQWNRDHTKKIPNKPRPKVFTKSKSYGDNRSRGQNTGKSYSNRPYKSYTKPYRNNNPRTK